MAALYAEDVEQYTGGRLTASDDRTEQMLAAALAAARRWCGWHVSPVLDEQQITLDGPGGPELVLPTLHLVELVSLTEDDQAVDISELQVSTTGRIRKKSGEFWTSAYGGIVATITHGWDDVPDWDAAVLSAVDAASLGIGQGTLTRKKVDDVEYQWASSAAMAEVLPVHQLSRFRLEYRP